VALLSRYAGTTGRWLAGQVTVVMHGIDIHKATGTFQFAQGGAREACSPFKAKGQK